MTASANADVWIVYITVPSAEEASRMAGTLLDERLCACASVLPAVTSHYWWQGKRERAEEALLMIKTTESAFERLSARVNALHAYDVPEIVAVRSAGGNRAYLDWVKSEVRA